MIVVVPFEQGQGSAVLFSGGLDSAVLLADAAQRGGHVQPLYVSVGLAWEAEERAASEHLLSAAPFKDVEPLVSLRFDMQDIYPATHWAIRGEAPGFDTPDEDVYLEGRNLVLLTKAAVFMARRKLTHVFIGPLAGNPFPDATPAFFELLARSLSAGLSWPIEIHAPFLRLHKSDLIALGRRLEVPLERTLSCMQPSAGVHCGKCSKCRERRDAFLEAGVSDPTTYASVPAR